MLRWIQHNVWPWSEITLLKAKLQAALDGWADHSSYLSSRFAEAEHQVAIRESLHEQEWLKNAAMQANVDFNYIQMLVETKQRVFNDELQCAKECYRRGMGYQQFPEFLAMYRGHYGMFDPYQGGGKYVKR